MLEPSNAMPSSESDPLLGNRHPEIQNNDDADGPSPVYQVYKRRFFFLAVVMLLNISSGINWITFSPIANIIGEFYNINSNKVDYLAVVFPILTIPFGFAAMGLLDTFGLRAGILIGAILNCLGSIVRMMSAFPIFPLNDRYYIVMLGQCLCAVAQPFILFLPTKTAALWFSDGQRTEANSAGSMANPLGILLASSLGPIIATTSSDLPLLLGLYVIPAGISLLLALFGVWSSVPPTPPSASAAAEHQPFLVGLKMLRSNKHFWILAVCAGTGVALFSTITTLLQQMLCPYGYSDKFVGICSFLIIGVGFIGAGVTGYIADKTKSFELPAKACFICAGLCMDVFLLLSQFSNQHAMIAVCLSLFGLFGFAMFPVSLELAVESTYPVSEATSSGILLIVGQALTIVFILGMQGLTTQMGGSQTETCSPDLPMQFKNGDIMLVFVAIVTGLVFMGCYRCSYSRQEAENAAAAEEIIQREERRQSELANPLYYQAIA